MQDIKLLIDGRSCAACSAAVEKALNRVAGVSCATVNLATGTALITTENDTVDAQLLQKAVLKAGFGCRIPDTQDSQTEQSEQTKGISPLKRILLILPFAIALMYLSYAAKLPLPFSQFLGSAEFAVYNASLQIILLIPLLVSAKHIYKKGFSSIIHKAPGMDALVSMGTLTATAYSIYLYVRLVLNGGTAAGLYFGSAGMILTFVMLGKALEENSRNKAAKAIRSLVALRPQNANLLRGDELVKVSASCLQEDDIILVKPGEKYPADGIVVNGMGDADESLLTGESLPVAKKTDDAVFCGAINLNGALQVRVTHNSSDTLLAGIIRTVEQAQASKAPIAKLADRISGIFAPTVFFVAVVTGIGWFIGTKDIAKAITSFISVLVVACPCALGLATPMAIIAATGRGAKDGILIRNGETLQKLADIDTVVFDKTGTLTNGKLTVSEVSAQIGTQEQLLYYAASADSASEHPIAKAITAFAAESGIAITQPQDMQAIAGKGVQAVIDGKTVLIGNLALLQENNIPVPTSTQKNAPAATHIFVATDGQYLGRISASDTVREQANEALHKLKSMHLQTVLVTGDNEAAATAVAKQLPIDRTYAGILPQGKSEVMQTLNAEGKKTVFVGDGINDAPALASADVGMSMGSGTDVAMETADAVLLRNDLNAVAQTLALSKKTMRIIKQNLAWAFGYNILMIPSAAGVLTLLGLPMPDPILAAAAMSLSSVAVVTNSLRLLKKQK